MSIAAFFDIDGTVYRGSLMIEHFRRLMKYEVIEPQIWYHKINELYVLWKNRQGDYDAFMEELADEYVKNLTGHNLNHIGFISEQVINLKGDAVYRYSRDRIQWHQQQGHRVIFISGSPDFLVSQMAEKYGVDDYIGSRYLTDPDGRFTGEVHKMWDSASKNRAIREFIDRYCIDPAQSYSYGDTNGDYSMLRMVGHPTTINPSRELLRMIDGDPELKARCRIVVERKDVIYHLGEGTTYE